jgi:subtilisin family serine protease
MLRSDKVIKVSAFNKRMLPAEFSNYGDLVTIYAPGEQINGLMPNLQEQYLDGTSMASPIVAGAIGLIKAKKKTLTNRELIALLKKNADPLSTESTNGLALRIDKVMADVN